MLGNPGSRNLPLEPLCFKSTTKMEEPSEAKSHWKQLPNELCHQMYDLCSVNAKLCLRMCCKRFRDETPGKVRGLYEDLNRTIDFGNAKFDRLCLDDTYTGSKKKRHVCSVCRRVHRAEEFTKQELEKDPRERVCEASQRTLDLTPGNHFAPISFSYQQLLNSRNVPLPLEYPYDEGFTFRPVDDESRQWMMVMHWTFPMEFPLPPAWTDGLRHLLEHFPVSACPHLISSEPQLLQSIVSYWDDNHANPAFAECPTCNTKVEFTLPTSFGGGDNRIAAPDVSFRVERRLGRLGESAVDPRWKAQSLPLLQM